MKAHKQPIVIGHEIDTFLEYLKINRDYNDYALKLHCSQLIELDMFMVEKSYENFNSSVKEEFINWKKESGY